MKTIWCSTLPKPRNHSKTLSVTQIPVEEKLTKVYDLSKDVTQQFFEVNTNPEVLRVSVQVVELMDNCLSQKGFGFHGLSQDKSNRRTHANEKENGE
jgi:hypothetical protein